MSCADARGIMLHEQLTHRDGKLFLPADLHRICPDWRERQAWVCGPPSMLEQAEQAWAAADLTDALHLERFGAHLSAATTTGGTLRFTASGRHTTIDGATTLMQAGERVGIDMPFGCRIGICHTCLAP